MLRNVLDDYLSHVKEREFDLPLLALLPAMGFYDIHFTHGQVEFGKDFIAKREENGIIIQYSFQSKADDINQTEWRNNIQGQMLESILTGLSHPDFDKSLPRQSVLVVTGRLIGNAAIGMQELNEKIENVYNERKIILWDKEFLISEIQTKGLASVFRANSQDFVSFGEFFILYGKCIQGDISERDIEYYSRNWLNGNHLEPNKFILLALTESEIIAQKCAQKGLLYEAINSRLSAIRAICFWIYLSRDSKMRVKLRDIYEQATKSIKSLCDIYVDNIRKIWIKSEKDLTQALSGSESMFSYLVHCARTLEIAGMLYFFDPKSEKKKDTANFIKDFVSKEPGAARVPSDRYSVSLVLPVIILHKNSFSEIAGDLLHRAAVWLCDRFQDGQGIASIDSTFEEEVNTLLGYPFDAVPLKPSIGSLLATVLCDLAAFIGDQRLFENIINDIKACKIVPEYWQCPDSPSLFQIEGEDVIAYPNIEFYEGYNRFDDFKYAEHIEHEPKSFQITECTDIFSLMHIMLLLRDRYFPTIWPEFNKY